MTLFEFDSYKLFLHFKINSLPKKGRGESLRLAIALSVHTTFVSHVLKRDSHFTIEQGLKVARHFSLNELETEYFINLIHLNRASDKPAQIFFEKQRLKLCERHKSLQERIPTQRTLSPLDQAKLYSQWYYLGIQILTAIDGFQNPNSIAAKLRLPQEAILEALQFLVETGLCIREGEKYRVGVTRTFVGRDSPLVTRHHTNWRLRVMQQFPDVPNDELVFTSPTSISRTDFALVREKLAQVIEDFSKIVGPSKDEEIACLNIDWVKIRG